MPITITQLNCDEVLRYMGTPPDKADDQTRQLAQTCAHELLGVLAPRWAYRVFGLEREEVGVRLDCGLLLLGQDLKTHLAGCERAAIFCATLGAGVDRLIRQAQGGDMARALALDCAGAVAVEQVCDEIELLLQEEFPACAFPFRFSPGYGDLPLTLQNPLLELLDAPRRVGLTASASHILLPRKSVTAILGVAKGAIAQTIRSCLGCRAHQHCQYRKAGGHCGIS